MFLFITRSNLQQLLAEEPAELGGKTHFSGFYGENHFALTEACKIPQDLLPLIPGALVLHKCCPSIGSGCHNRYPLVQEPPVSPGSGTAAQPSLSPLLCTRCIELVGPPHGVGALHQG